MARAITDEFEEEEVDVIEHNGNITLVENKRGEQRWVCPFELEDDG